MPIHFGRIAPSGHWDSNILERLFANELYPTGLEFKRVEGFPNRSGAILSLPGRYWVGRASWINEAITRYRWLLLIKCGDEEDLFDLSQIEHENVKFWSQTPRVDQPHVGARFYGVGHTPHFDNLPSKPPPKTLDVFLSGQNTHPRRKQAFKALRRFSGEDNAVWPTMGFTEGVPPAEYAAMMCNAKVAPCPSGAVSPDSFRLWEALQAHCIPIADELSPVYESCGYWDHVFPNAPFPVYSDADRLPGLVDEALADWPATANRVTAGWMRHKRQMARWLVEDLQDLGAV